MIRHVTTSTREPPTCAWIRADICRQEGAICSKNRKIIPYHRCARILKLTVSIPDYGSCRNSTQMFMLLFLFHLQAGSILKRSPDKNELSEPGRYKDRSHIFFIRKFWILPILNNDRSGKFVYKYINKSKFPVVCSLSLKINWILFLYYLKRMSGCMKSSCEARVINVTVVYENYTF